jgi:hypothetical protein
VLADESGLAELKALGARSVPVLSKGDKFTYTQSLKAIVEFVGLNEKTTPDLTPAELHQRLGKFMDAAIALLPLMPADRLDVHVPGRPRSYRHLAFHMFRVVAAFLDAIDGITLVQDAFREVPADDATMEWVAGYGAMVKQRLDAWWARTSDRDGTTTLDTYYGPQSLHDLFERTTWHCGQHVRQWMMLLEREGVSITPPLVAADFAKLPMPQNVWDG